MTEVVVDTSVFMALMLREPDAQAYMAALAEVCLLYTSRRG